jgi:serine/threonine protein kinase
MDLWSVGCIFAEMVNGKLLFEIPIENPLHNSETITNSEQVMGSGTSRCDIVKMLRAIVEILGPLPLPLYSSALFYQQLVQDKQLLDFQNE